MELVYFDAMVSVLYIFLHSRSCLFSCSVGRHKPSARAGAGGGGDGNGTFLVGNIDFYRTGTLPPPLTNKVSRVYTNRGCWRGVGVGFHVTTL
jgi:hypothetical protein